MRFKFLFVLLLMTSGQSFCQSIRQQNKELEIKSTVLKEIVDSLLQVQSGLNDSIYKAHEKNARLIQDLLALYDDTEEKKFRLHVLINETNDSLIDWKMFYRYEDISLDKLKKCRDTLLRQPLGISALIDPLSDFLTERKRMNLKERNAFLTQQLVFLSALSTNLGTTIVQLGNQLMMKQMDHSKLNSWKEIIDKTRNYCLGKSGPIPVKIPESKGGWLCGTDLENRADVDTLLYEISEPDFYEIPKFPGGMEALKAYFESELKQAVFRSEDPDLKKIYVKFVVTDNGEIRNPIITKGPDCLQCNNAVLQIVQDMPRWIPATKRGNPVSSEFRLPLRLN